MPHWIIWSWYTGHWWVGCYVWYSEEGTVLAAAPHYQNVTAHPSTASVPITVLLYSGPLLVDLMWQLKGWARIQLYVEVSCEDVFQLTVLVCSRSLMLLVIWSSYITQVSCNGFTAFLSRQLTASSICPCISATSVKVELCRRFVCLSVCLSVCLWAALLRK